MPFSQKSREGDFMFYTAIDSLIPNPFNSINDFIPTNDLESLPEFFAYKSFWTNLHHAVAKRDESSIRQDI